MIDQSYCSISRIQATTLVGTLAFKVDCHVVWFGHLLWIELREFLRGIPILVRNLYTHDESGYSFSAIYCVRNQKVTLSEFALRPTVSKGVPS